MNKTCEVVFPLSPKRLLFMSWNKAVPDTIEVPRANVDGVNAGLAAQSDRYLYAHINDKRLGALAAKFKYSKPGITTQGFGPKKFAKIKVPRRMTRG